MNKDQIKAEFMASARYLPLTITILGLLAASQSMGVPGSNFSSARSLDGLLQSYAYRAFDRPRTGKPYTAVTPSNLSGISLTVLRLRSGSFRYRGYRTFKEFDIPVGVLVEPYVERLALVYQNLGNWSSIYYHLPGYTLVAPVLGLLAYEAANLSAINLPELDLIATGKPISVRFTEVSRARGMTVKCVFFYLNGTVGMKNSTEDNVCETYIQGHFSMAVSSSEVPPATAPILTPARSKKKVVDMVWKIVGIAVGGFLFLVVVLVLVLWVVRLRKNRRMERLAQREEAGEVLQRRRVGSAQLPMASMIRTKPELEDEQVP
ncbi:transmembrane protein, putative (DUF1191) [Wolffia australiana]